MNRSKLFLILAILALCFSCTSYHVTDVYSDLTYRVVPATLNHLQKEFHKESAPALKHGKWFVLPSAPFQPHDRQE